MKTIWNKIKNGRGFLLSLSFLLVAAGCPNKNNNSTPPVGVGVVPQPCGSAYCPAGGAGALLATGMGVHRLSNNAPEVYLELNFYAQSGVVQDPSIPYSGNVTVSGAFTILGGCMAIPPGTYPIMSNSGGPFQAGLFNLQLQLQGPIMLSATLANGSLNDVMNVGFVGPQGAPYQKFVAGQLYIPQCGNVPFALGN